MVTENKLNRAHIGFTLVELVVAMVLVGIISIAVTAIVRTSYESWNIASDRNTAMLDGKSVMDYIARELRGAKQIDSVTGPAVMAGIVRYTTLSDVKKEISYDSTNKEVKIGPIGHLTTLSKGITKVQFTSFDKTLSTLANPVTVDTMSLLKFEIIFFNVSQPAVTITLFDQVFLERTQIQDIDIAINEIMYDPAGSPEADYQWIEYYNKSIDTNYIMTDWKVSLESDGTNPQTLYAHPYYGTGNTTIAYNDFAVILPHATTVFTELITNGHFATTDLTGWRMDASGDYAVTKFNAQNSIDQWKIEWQGGSNTRLNQSIVIPPMPGYVVMVVWEYTTVATPSDTSILIEVRDTADLEACECDGKNKTPVIHNGNMICVSPNAATAHTNHGDTLVDVSGCSGVSTGGLLATVYSGPASSTWTPHFLDISSLKGKSVDVQIKSNSTSSGTILYDSISVHFSPVRPEAIIMTYDSPWTSLNKSAGSITLFDASNLKLDNVNYQSSWGGSSGGNSLARINSSGTSNEESNWQDGTAPGTPGDFNANSPVPSSGDYNDTDGDGVPDNLDVCEGNNDTLDGDNDTVPDGCDLCSGFDDRVDTDSNDIPDGCEVIDPAIRLVQIRDALQIIIDDDPGASLSDKLEDVRNNVISAISKLNASDNSGAIGEIEGAVGDLEAAVKDGLFTNNQDGVDLLIALVNIARQLGLNEITLAIANSGHSGDISDANMAISDGDTLRDSGDYNNSEYKDATSKYKASFDLAEGSY